MFARLKLWLAAAGAVVLAIAGTALTFWLKGRKAGRDAAAGDVATAKTEAAVSDGVAAQLEARIKNDAQVKALDSAPTPAAADAAVDNNLGGWLRDADETSKQG